jgi:GH35 family endo-1,4-beta-xylanase
MTKKISRRDFLKITGITSASLALTACGVKTTELPTVISVPPTAILLPTKTLAPTPTPIPTLIPTSTPTLSLEQLPKTKQVLANFVNAFRAADINVSSDHLLQKGLEIRTVEGKDETKYQVALVHIENSDGFGGDYPLMIKTEEKEWHETTLRDMADYRGIKIGTNYGTPYFDPGTIQTLKNLVAKHYNFAIIDTIALHQTEKIQGVFSFSKADKAVKEAMDLGMFIEGDDLLFGASNQKSTYMKDFKEKGASRQELLDAVYKHIDNVVGHFKGRINQWSVVCEPGSYPGEDVYKDIIGDDYVDLAFQRTKDIDPSAKRILTQARTETRSGKNYLPTKRIVERLKAKGLIDGIAIELHIDSAHNPSKEKLIETFKSFEGVEVIASSIDINMSKISGTDAEKLRKQATIGKMLFEVMSELGVSTITFWEGFGDQYNWLVRNLNMAKSMGTPFDNSLNPKAIYYALLQKIFEESKLSV